MENTPNPKSDLEEWDALWFKLNNEERAILRGMMLARISQRRAQEINGRVFVFTSSRATPPYIIGG